MTAQNSIHRQECNQMLLSTIVYRRTLTAASIAVCGFAASFSARAATDGTPYFQSVVCYSSTSNQCLAQFPTVPEHKRLVVKFISAFADTPTAFATGEFEVPVGGNSGAFFPILFTLQGQDSAGNNIYVTSQPMLYFWEAGQAPRFFMNAQAGNVNFLSGGVTLTGYLVDAK